MFPWISLKMLNCQQHIKPLIFIGPMTSSPCNIRAMKKGSCSGLSEYISIGNPHWLISELYFCSINLATISFQYCLSVFLFYHIVL